MDKKIITIYNFDDHSEFSSAVYEVGDEKGLTLAEKYGVYLGVGDTVDILTSGVDDLRQKITFQVVNAYDNPTPPKNIGDGVIFGGTLGSLKVPERYFDYLQSVIHWIVNRNIPFLGICLGHQLLAETFGGEISKMDSGIIGTGNIYLNSIGMRDSLFAQLNTSSFGSVWWHTKRVSNIGNDITALGGNERGEFQVIKVGDRAWGIQGHPDLTIDRVTGLIKLGTHLGDGGRDDFYNIAPGLAQSRYRNESEQVISAFVRQVINS